MFRECLIAVLAKDAKFEVSEVNLRYSDFHEDLDQVPPDVILVDAGLPGKTAVELIRRIRQANGPTKILAVVSSAAQGMAIDCIAAGAHGCVLEESSLADLRAGINAVQQGETFCSQDMIQTVLSQFARLAQESHLRKKVKSLDLTPRELEILELISRHMGNKQIAKLLSVSLYTVKNHVHNILEKLELESRYEAVDYAQQRHWIKRADEKLRAQDTRLPAHRVQE